jgi:hypothetical protein
MMMSRNGEDASSAENTSSGPIFYDDFGQDDCTPPSPSISTSSPGVDMIANSPDADVLYQQLNRRITQVTNFARGRLLKNWRRGKAKSYAAFSINELQDDMKNRENDLRLPFDWVRRLDIGEYPRVACGSAHGSIFVADVEARQVLAVARGVHYSRHSNDFKTILDEKLQQYIYGDYDGGGVLDVGMFGKNIVASVGREGGVRLFKLVENSNTLIYQGNIPEISIVVTCTKFDSDGKLYLGGSDGILRVVTFPPDFLNVDDVNLMNAQDLEVTVVPHSLDEPVSPILSLDVSESLDMAVTAHANGNVCLHSMKKQSERNSVIGVWNPFAKNKSCARSVTFASRATNVETKYAVVVGGGNGEMWLNIIDPDSKKGEGVVFKDEFVQKLEPDHIGPVISLASRPQGLIMSVGHDGMIRMTQTWISGKIKKMPSPVYGLGGYKVWIGSICVDDEGKRLISDGMDDAVVVHDFSLDKNE